jgi:sporulation protein YlmC with PRC-barrel domain
MHATDGEIGEVKEFYFNDETWAISYLIVETGNWLNSRKVLISPQALLVPDWSNNLFPVNLSREQIKNSPDIDSDKPVSSQQEFEMYSHYAWKRYVGSGYYAAGLPVADLQLVDNEIAEKGIFPHHDISNDNRHLRSTDKIAGYHIHATDGDIGHVKDFILDDQTWQITDLIVDTHNWIGGKKVLIPVCHIKEIQWANDKINIDIKIDAVQNSAELTESEFMFPQNVFEV